MSTLPQPEGRKLLRIEARNQQVPREEHPDWLKTRVSNGPNYQEMRGLVKRGALNTVCAEANCPNIYECWEDREASFLIGGAICTRRCAFCDIATGRPEGYDQDEPRRLAESVEELGLRYVTITGVARDDLPDGASWLYAESCRQIHARMPGTGVELLVDDFKGDVNALEEVFSARPQVFAHNIETVPRLMKIIRPAFRYERSLAAIRAAKDAGIVTKSNLILGLGETREEIEQTMHDLLEAGCDILTITQYLRPSPLHHPIDRWVKPQEFIELRDLAYEMGFPACMSGPLVRSSYRSGKLWVEVMQKLGREIPADFHDLVEFASQGVAHQEAHAVQARLDARAARKLAKSGQGKGGRCGSKNTASVTQVGTHLAEGGLQIVSGGTGCGCH